MKRSSSSDSNRTPERLQADESGINKQKAISGMLVGYLDGLPAGSLVLKMTHRSDDRNCLRCRYRRPPCADSSARELYEMSLVSYTALVVRVQSSLKQSGQVRRSSWVYMFNDTGKHTREQPDMLPRNGRLLNSL